MTRRVIEKHLLVSGSPPRPELLELHRDCLAKGLRFERSGEFGIGVLSYFMISDKMIVETRSGGDLVPDKETHGWHFEIDGLDNVGELRPAYKHNRGTIVRLRLREDAKPKFETEQFNKFLSRVVTKVPCNVEIAAFECNRSIAPGWAMSMADWTHVILTESFNKSSGDRFRFQAEGAAEAEKRWSAIRDLARSKIHLFGPKEGYLPNGAGSFRLALPYFELRAGASLGFLHEVDEQLFALPDNELCIFIGGRLSFSWRGFATSTLDDSLRSEVSANVPIIVELDFVDNAKISVSRSQLVPEHRAELVEFLANEVHSLLMAFMRFQTGSRYAAITLGVFEQNRIYRNTISRNSVSAWELPRDIDLAGALAWWLAPSKIASDDRRFTWRMIEFPAIQREGHALLSNDIRKRAGLCDELLSLSVSQGQDISPLPGVDADRLIIVDGASCEMGIVYNNAPRTAVGTRLPSEIAPRVSFPREWLDIAVIETSDGMLFNKDHPILKAQTTEGWLDFLRKRTTSDYKTLTQVASLSKESAGAWLLYNFDEDIDFWRSFHRDMNAEFAMIFKLLGLSRFFKWTVDMYSPGIISIGLDMVEHFPGIIRPGTHPALPSPTEESWWLAKKRSGRRKTKGRIG